MRRFCAWGDFLTALAGVLPFTALATSLQPTQQPQQQKGPGLQLLYFATFLSYLGAYILATVLVSHYQLPKKALSLEFASSAIAHVGHIYGMNSVRCVISSP